MNIVKSIFWLAIGLAILVLAFGCATKVVPTQPETPAQTITNVVKNTGGLATVGWIVVAVGVFGFFNGWKQATGLVAAGIALVAGVLAYAVANDLIQAWLPLIKWAFPILGLIASGIWYYNHSLRTSKVKILATVTDMLDKDKDGKLTLSDVKAYLGV